MRSCVRFNSGGSGAFVSSGGLVMTNQHVGSDTLQRLSSESEDLLEQGFLALETEEERRAPGLEIDQLVRIECVTERVRASVEEGMSVEEATAARRAVIADIESENSEKTQNKCEVVTLYGGARYQLYEFKTFTDVRLVWAPENAIARFGGDADNFEYPRYCLDVCLFRVYENGRPAVTESHLKWNDAGPQEGELVFVAGNPGRSSRMSTAAALRYERDVRLPHVLDFIRRREILLQQYSLGGDEEERQAADELMTFQNARKAYSGMLSGLQHPACIDFISQRESALRSALDGDPETEELATAWDAIEQIHNERRILSHHSFTLNTTLFRYAQTLVRLAAEEQKPNTERLREYQDANRASLERRLLSEAPVYKRLEQFKLADLISRTLEIRGAEDPLCVAILNGQSPPLRASELVNTTRLADPEFRRQLVEQGSKAIEACDDPMIEFARLVDPEQRRLADLDEQLDEREIQSYAQISRARYHVHGEADYPDATFTPRLSFGVVNGYHENSETVPAFTDFTGLFARADLFRNRSPWQLPETWRETRQDLDSSQRFNFVCTADIIGGNSGSPVVNKDLEITGIIFDGNVQSLTGDYYYSEDQARAVAVHAGAISFALERVYNASSLANQLGQ